MSSKGAFERAIEDFFYYFDQNGDGFVTVNEAKKVLRVAISGVGGATDSLNDNKKLEAEVDRQVKVLLSKADHDNDKKISLNEFQSYYAEMMKNGMEPEVLLLDIDKATKALKAHNIDKSPKRKKKEPPKDGPSDSAALCIVRTFGGSSSSTTTESGSSPAAGVVAGRLKIVHTFTLGPYKVTIKGQLKGLQPAKQQPSSSSSSTTFMLDFHSKEGKSKRFSLGKIVSDDKGSCNVDIEAELPEGMTLKDIQGNNKLKIVDSGGSVAATTQVFELHK
mmetsp:Transcript_13835/g.16543  ORF Transcript_13835/g.16543 Transcript_13835/m.16543 type:complete len:277 (+) Transcript_13835:171-1001(+)